VYQSGIGAWARRRYPDSGPFAITDSDSDSDSISPRFRFRTPIPTSVRMTMLEDVWAFQAVRQHEGFVVKQFDGRTLGHDPALVEDDDA